MKVEEIVKEIKNKNAKAIIIPLGGIEKLYVDRDGRTRILRDGFGTIQRPLYPREVSEVHYCITTGDYTLI